MDCLLRKVVSPGFPLTRKKSGTLSVYASSRKINIATHYMGRDRLLVLNELMASNWGWEFKIGLSHVGSSFFKSEYPDYEIVAEYRPIVRDRKHRFAIYAKCLMGKYAI